jgi:hypothetical protein
MMELLLMRLIITLPSASVTLHPGETQAQDQYYLGFGQSDHRFVKLTVC